MQPKNRNKEFRAVIDVSGCCDCGDGNGGGERAWKNNMYYNRKHVAKYTGLFVCVLFQLLHAPVVVAAVFLCSNLE